MPSQGVLDRQRVAEAVLATTRTHAHPVGVRMQTNLAAVQDGEVYFEEIPDGVQLQLVLARELRFDIKAKGGA